MSGYFGIIEKALQFIREKTGEYNMAFMLPISIFYFFPLWCITGSFVNGLICSIGVFFIGFPIIEYREQKKIRDERTRKEEAEKEEAKRKVEEEKTKQQDEETFEIRKSMEWFKTLEINYNTHINAFFNKGQRSNRPTKFLEKNGFTFEVFFLEYFEKPFKLSLPFCSKCKGQLVFDEGKNCICGKKCGFEKTTNQTISEIMRDAAIQFDIPLYPN
ncbi:MAG: hypothetical protein HQM10_03795 [Candidatus Riflebacteria bacterium]|nr:hypothetical protein [Candidatus Riflebacteria bacterium]